MSPANTTSMAEPTEAETIEFIAKLRAYHEKRGTTFDPQPRVGAKVINLLKLFNIVIARGGYDVVSDEKLLWRKLGGEFDLGVHNAPALAFSLKTVYYKTLAAYEMSTIHNREPPPKEILEYVTAKGSGLLTRTVENYKPKKTREATALAGGEDSEGSDEEGTPAREANGGDEVHGSGGRATRGLRQAPPQRTLFQPETQSSRQPRSSSHGQHTNNQQHQQKQHQHQHQAQHHSQQQHIPRGASTSYNPSSNMENMSMAVTNYEPRPQIPLAIRQVTTPGNNPGEFARQRRAQAMANTNGKPSSSLHHPLLPGTGFDGPNIYVRCLCALRSGIPTEQDYALHHLVKISMERGDKYRFESFPGLAEALVEKLLEVSSLFYKVDWEISYTGEGEMAMADRIDGLQSNVDIIKKIAKLAKLPVDDNIQSAEFADAMLQINEAALTMRNMVMLEENAQYVSELYPLQAFLAIALNLPEKDSVVELKHYALDISEQITKYLSSDQDDPLYISLLGQLQSSDRGAILTSLRAIGKISMNLEDNNLLRGVPVEVVRNIIDWILLNDEDLGHACLDFLYQYTAVVQNVDFLLSEVQLESLVNQLTRLLMHNARTHEKEMSLGRDSILPPPRELPQVPQELLTQLSNMNEPERSSRWLKCLFEEDSNEYLTQIQLWQAYQNRFIPIHEGRGLLQAADFIKNVSTTFGEKVSAQVQPGAVPKFIIKGIRMRHIPVDLNGEAYKPCQWRDSPSQGPKECGFFCMTPEDMYRHVLKDHVGVTQRQDGRFENNVNVQDQQLVCHWNRCQRFGSSPASSTLLLASHLKTHLAPAPVAASKDTSDHGAPPPAKRHKPSYFTPAPKQQYKWRSTAGDERQDAAGIPLSAVLVLRNLARNIPKTQTEDITLKGGGVSWVERVFKPVEPHLFEVMAHNTRLFSYMGDLLSAIKNSSN